ncbi:MAG: hypothetical protein JSS07_10045 [Proteobacteria bacterium]|nr:hypothetical protein [Pseudomonadota bacterium]
MDRNQAPARTDTNINLVAQSAKQISNIFNEKMNQFTIAPYLVQGFKEQYFLGYASRSPLQLNNLLGPTFWRTFDPLLKIAIDDIKSSANLDKPKLHAFLLEKYLGIKDISLSLDTTLTPNAFSSIPISTAEDIQLHKYFLQPFKLFGITENNRKFQGNDPIFCMREWLWAPKKAGCDSAPLFRQIIQIYILSSIIQDYTDNTEPVLLNPALKETLDLLKQKNQQMLQELNNQTATIFKAIDVEYKQNPLSGSPNGILGASNASQQIDTQLNGFMDIASLYPVGRLFFGQSSHEPHHVLASQNISPARTIKTNLNYAFNWFIAHLNISTSFFWVRTAFNIFVTKWKAIKEYATNPNAEFTDLLRQSLLFIPNALILALTPLLILLPWVYGISSTPFTLLRSFFIYGPFAQLRNFNYLKMIDVLELLKDSLIFWYIGIPFLNLVMAGMATFIPAALLIPAYYTTIFAVVFVLAIFSSNHFRSDDIDFARLIAQTNFGMFFGTSMFIGVIAYLGLGCVGRIVYPYIPTSVSNRLRQLTTPIQLSLDKAIKYLVKDKNNFDPTIIIPKENQQTVINMPKVKVTIKVPEEIKAEIQPLFFTLSNLVQCNHFSKERKALIVGYLDKLNEDNVTSIDELKQNIQNAKLLLKDNFDPAEVKIMDKLIKHLKSLDVSIDATENVSMIKMRANPNGAYQPSWKMLQNLREKGIITPDGLWQAVDGIDVPESMKQKCHHIFELKAKLS